MMAVATTPTARLNRVRPHNRRLNRIIAAQLIGAEPVCLPEKGFLQTLLAGISEIRIGQR